MTKVIFTEKLSKWDESEPVTVTVHDEYWEFASKHLPYLREEKPVLMNALLLCGEMGSYLNMMAKAEMVLTELYKEHFERLYSEMEDDFYTPDVIQYLIETEVENAVADFEFYEEEE